MCVMKYSNGDINISMKEIEEMWSNNPDGAGIGVLDVNNNLISSFKTKNLDEFKERVSNVFEHKQFNHAVMHFRRRSRGSFDLINVNPLKVNEDTLFFHNGTLSHLNDKELSDSNIFVRDFLSKIKDFDISDPAIVVKIHELLDGNISRMIFLQSGSESPLIIDNANLGYWNEAKTIWTSNREH